MNVAAEAVALITRLRSRGISVRLEENRLFAIGTAGARLTTSDRTALGAYRLEIIRLLTQEAEEPEPDAFEGAAPPSRRARQAEVPEPIEFSSAWPDSRNWQHAYATTGQHPLWCATCRGRTSRLRADGSVGCPYCAGS